MMRSLAFILATALAVPALAQDVVPDTLDWRGYYPLQVGNVWEWRTELFVAYEAITHHEIVGDTMIDGRLYYVQQEYTAATDHATGESGSRTDTTLLRYDSERALVVQHPDDGGVDSPHTCDLSAAFGSVLSGHCNGDLVSGWYAEVGAELQIGDSGAPYRSLKAFINLGGGTEFYHGIGMLPGVGDGSTGSIWFTYLKVGGAEYGERTVYVGLEGGPRTDDARFEVYPNPASGTPARVAFATAKPGTVALDLVDLLGRRIQTLADGFYYPGRNEVTLDASSLPAGVYFVRLWAGDRVETRSLVVAR